MKTKQTINEYILRNAYDFNKEDYLNKAGM